MGIRARVMFVGFRPTEEQIIGVRAVASNFENLNHVEELAVYITDHGDRRLDVDDIALFHQQLFCFGAYRFNDGLGEELLVVQSGYAFVEIYAGCSARRRRR
jgi:hypothetical protein